eukprot:12315039-Alexandrium_andersonii.AAC.1
MCIRDSLTELSPRGNLPHPLLLGRVGLARPLAGCRPAAAAVAPLHLRTRRAGVSGAAPAGPGRSSRPTGLPA